MAILASASCNEKKEVMSPEAVVEAFSRAVAAGDFSSARAFCDTLSMDTYLENYKKVMSSLQKEDSAATAIASSILAGAEFEVSDVAKKDDTRIVRYTLRAGSNQKDKEAVLKKVEGEWRVTTVIDVI